MADPLLSSLCTICHIHVPKYTCPRCAVQTCSLPCSRRHKLWSECSGIRDPTVYKPRSELATPSGVDHDYNFLHSIEARVERTEKEIVEDRGLVQKQELQAARKGDRYGVTERKKELPGEVCIKRMLDKMGTRVHRAPKGMKRNTDNETSWSKHKSTINWQVEIFQYRAPTRRLCKMIGSKPIGHLYDEFCKGERKNKMSEEEWRTERKRKAEIQREKQPQGTKRGRFQKGRRQHGYMMDLTTTSRLQNPSTGAWNKTPSIFVLPTGEGPAAEAIAEPRTHNHALYLLRPLTPSCYPKVLIPLDVSKSLTELLRRRELLEFPTIYAFEDGVGELPDEFMLEADFLTVARGAFAMGSRNIVKVDGAESDDSDNDSSSDGDAHTSVISGDKSSESDSESAAEEGEIV